MRWKYLEHHPLRHMSTNQTAHCTRLLPRNCGAACLDTTRMVMVLMCPHALALIQSRSRLVSIELRSVTLQLQCHWLLEFDIHTDSVLLFFSRCLFAWPDYSCDRLARSVNEYQQCFSVLCWSAKGKPQCSSVSEKNLYLCFGSVNRATWAIFYSLCVLFLLFFLLLAKYRYVSLSLILGLAFSFRCWCLNFIFLLILFIAGLTFNSYQHLVSNAATTINTTTTTTVIDLLSLAGRKIKIMNKKIKLKKIK